MATSPMDGKPPPPPPPPPKPPPIGSVGRGQSASIRKGRGVTFSTVIGATWLGRKVP